MGKLKVESMVLGAMGTNCYLAMNIDTKALLIIDPPSDEAVICERIGAMGGRPEAVLLTHGHFDHIGVAQALHEKLGVPVYALDAEQEILEDPGKNLSRMFGTPFTVKADRYLRDGQILELAGMQIQVIHTPGHTIGGACYYIPSEHVLFSGDTLFYCSVGRTDFPTGSMGELHRSIHEKLFVLPEDTAVLPGHNMSTNIGFEKKFNPY